ncbi:MAG: hypothetical protein ABFS56_28750 [Pseudomonadota bacterium]
MIARSNGRVEKVPDNGLVSSNDFLSGSESEVTQHDGTSFEVQASETAVNALVSHLLLFLTHVSPILISRHPKYLIVIT